jgi:hypothetical protein
MIEALAVQQAAMPHLFVISPHDFDYYYTFILENEKRIREGQPILPIDSIGRFKKFRPYQKTQLLRQLLQKRISESNGEVRILQIGEIASKFIPDELIPRYVASLTTSEEIFPENLDTSVEDIVRQEVIKFMLEKAEDYKIERYTSNFFLKRKQVLSIIRFC